MPTIDNKKIRGERKPVGKHPDREFRVEGGKIRKSETASGEPPVYRSRK